MLFNNTNMRTAMAYTNAVGDKVYPIIVDIKKGIKSTEEVSFVSSDINTGVLSVAFIQGNDTYNVEGAEVICSIMRPDTTTLEIPCNAVNGNTIEVPLGVNGTSQDGVYSFDFKVFKGEDKIVGTPIMNYSVSLSISNDLVIEEDDRLPVLTMLITQVNELKEETRETINQSNVATEASKEATANAIEATNNANAVSERVSQETSEAISRVDNTIVELNNTVSEKVSELDNAKSDMTTTVSNKVNEVETRFNALTSSQQQASEVIDARDGEVSLKARLDRDIEKAKQVYVELEGSYISTESSTGDIQDIQILGNTVQDPNNLADIKSVGELQEDGTYKMSILSCGKNLLNINTLARRSYIQSSNGDVTPVGDNTNPATSEFIKVNPNSSYIISFENPRGVFFGEYDCNRKFIKKSSQVSKLITSENTRYIRVQIGFVTSDEVQNIQLEEGTVATPYEPYQGNKCDILLPCQLEKVGDVSDRLYYDDVEKAWCIEKNIGEVVLNGSENWRFHSTKPNTSFFQLSVSSDIYKLPINNNIKANILSSSFINEVPNTGYNKYDIECIYLDNTRNLSIRIFNSKLNSLDLEGFLEYLKQNPTLVKYQLATPQKIILPLDVQIQLNSFFGTTHVYMESGEVEGTIKCKVPKSLGATVQSLNNKTDILSDRIEAIEGLKDSQNMKYETDKGYLVCKETKNGVIDDLKIEGKTLVNVLRLGGNWFEQETTLQTDSMVNVGLSSYTKSMDISLLKSNTVYTVIPFVDYTVVKKGILYVQLNTEINGVQSSVFRLNEDTFNKPTRITTNELTNKNIRSLFIGGSNCEYKFKNVKILILEGDHTQNPPSYFEGLMSVGQDVDEIVVSSVKGDGNLFDSDINSYVQTNIIANVGSKLELSSENLSRITLKSNVKVNPSKTYFLTPSDLYDYGVICTNDNDIVVYNSMWSNAIEFKLPQTSRKLFIYAKRKDGQNIDKQSFVCENHVFSTIKYNSHTPHQSDKKQILFYNENGELEPVTELHEWDSIEKHSDNKWYYHKRSGKVVLNGSESWTFEPNQSSSDTLLFYSSISDSLGNQMSTLICNKFKSSSSSIWETTNNSELCMISPSKNFMVRILKSKLSSQDVTGFKQWLQANNVTVVYQLAEEEVYEIAPLHLDSYANETLILCNSGAISPKMEFSITSHINELVKSQGDRISLLEEKMYKALKQVLAGDMYSLAELLYPEDFVEENPENEIMLLPFE